MAKNYVTVALAVSGAWARYGHGLLELSGDKRLLMYDYRPIKAGPFPPALVVLSYAPAKATKTVAMVGKVECGVASVCSLDWFYFSFSRALSLTLVVCPSSRAQECRTVCEFIFAMLVETLMISQVHDVGLYVNLICQCRLKRC